MATKLNQIIAVEKGAKTRAFSKITDAYQLLQKPAVLSGISRSYQPVDEDGEKYPPESTKVQVKADELIAEVTSTLTELFDVTATKDWANCAATADVVVDGETILTAVPVTTCCSSRSSWSTSTRSSRSCRSSILQIPGPSTPRLTPTRPTRCRR